MNLRHNKGTYGITNTANILMTEQTQVKRTPGTTTKPKVKQTTLTAEQN